MAGRTTGKKNPLRFDNGRGQHEEETSSGGPADISRG